MLAGTNMQTRTQRSHIIKELILPVLLVLGCSWVASLPVSWDFGWYTALAKPAFTPPPWTFSVVWPSLYVLMTWAAWLVWRERDARDNEAQEALALFIFQLVVNFFWPLFFFGMQSLWLGLVWNILLWVLVGMTLLFFYPLSRLSALLLLPYWLWTSFAVWLSYGVWSLNS